MNQCCMFELHLKKNDFYAFNDNYEVKCDSRNATLQLPFDKVLLVFLGILLQLLNIQHQPFTTRTFIAVTSILCYRALAVISVLPFLISWFFLLFFFTHSLTASISWWA